jgi:hypothetical protein
MGCKTIDTYGVDLHRLYVLSKRSQYKIKQKRGHFDKLKDRLVIQDQHMKIKDETGKGDFTDDFSLVPHVSGLRIPLAITF